MILVKEWGSDMPKLREEIFAVGKWNGMTFTLADLQKMKASFDALKSVLKVPLKLGHNDEQPVLDGQPALGWVEAMEVDTASTPAKLVAIFDNVPSIMMETFKKKLYRGKSIELDMDVHHKGKFYDFVITAVALLGSDMPAVNVLNDLGALLMSRNGALAQGDFVVGRQQHFTAISGNKEVQSTMTPEEEQKLRTDLATAQAAVTTLKADNEAASKKFAADKADLEKRIGDMEKSQQADKVAAARTKFTAILEKAVKEKAITPAQRESFSRLLRLDDDEAVLKIKEEDVTGLFAEKDKNRFTRDVGDEEGKEELDNDAAQTLSDKTYQFMSTSGEKNFGRALEIVMRANPDLAHEYRDANGEVASHA